MVKIPKIFRAFGADFLYLDVFFTVFYLRNHCFPSFMCYFFAPAAPKLLRVTTETVRESTNNQTSQTGTSEEWNILTRREIHLFFVEMRRRRENFEFYGLKTGFPSAKTHFLKLSEAFSQWKRMKKSPNFRPPARIMT